MQRQPRKPNDQQSQMTACEEKLKDDSVILLHKIDSLYFTKLSVKMEHYRATNVQQSTRNARSEKCDWTTSWC